MDSFFGEACPRRSEEELVSVEEVILLVEELLKGWDLLLVDLSLVLGVELMVSLEALSSSDKDLHVSLLLLEHLLELWDLLSEHGNVFTELVGCGLAAGLLNLLLTFLSELELQDSLHLGNLGLDLLDDSLESDNLVEGSISLVTNETKLFLESVDLVDQVVDLLFFEVDLELIVNNFEV